MVINRMLAAMHCDVYRANTAGPSQPAAVFPLVKRTSKHAKRRPKSAAPARQLVR